MNRSIIPGILFFLGGTLIAILPHVIFPVCESMVLTASGGSMHMKCFWTARAETGVGAMIALGGLLYCLYRDTGVRLGIAAMTALAALLVMALPTGLIGVCMSETMPCRMGTLPGLVVSGTAMLLIALVTCWSLYRAMKEEKRP